MHEITVHVVKYPDRDNLVMRYVDTLTRKPKAKSARTTKRREAEKKAAKWEAELREGRYHEPSKVTWEDFRDRYEEFVAQEHADKTFEKVVAVFNVIESLMKVQRIGDLDQQRLERLKSEMLKGRAPSTVASYFAHLRSALGKAVDWGLLAQMPKFPKVKRRKGAKIMRGRAVTAEEFDRMLAAAPKVVGDQAAPSWRFLLHGLWTSGLRLGDICDLYWGTGRGHTIDLNGRRPMFVIRGELEKGNRDRLLPMAPEFAELLAQVPTEARKGRVFRPAARRKDTQTPQRHRVGELIGAMGEAAGIIVDTDPKTGNATKFASAHDLRRSFGQRWAKRVMPAVLQTLMRHASIQTTMQYYVSIEAEVTADILWEATGNNLGNSRDSEADQRAETPINTVDRGGLEPPTPGFSVQCSTN